ncbi:hypothetical protein D047_5082B, partial [Vibrio parahaemolyticus VPTS-2010_2]
QAAITPYLKTLALNKDSPE